VSQEESVFALVFELHVPAPHQILLPDLPNGQVMVDMSLFFLDCPGLRFVTCQAGYGGFSLARRFQDSSPKNVSRTATLALKTHRTFFERRNPGNVQKLENPGLILRDRQQHVTTEGSIFNND
jgi:hypothetical protein